jgi:hypothetical protein
MKKEDFEQRGWKFSYEFVCSILLSGFENEMKFEKGDVWKDDGQGAFLYVKTKKTEYEMDGKNHSFNTYMIKLITTDSGFNQDGPNHSTKFNGECDTMDEFDMICKMIKLKI